ncbi:hypothetical protein GGQ88_000492 [Novosphingobium hassiacum]|uniref:DUF6869 domain-containing protein n=1 Tax=Novosphingobium hassiacum TaxID=173676 RepID=A0A7W5ZW54_9SPHN|nr:hypothetical protein [Novosphingobium hassiacum]MBB3859252.1 hypothetical protein [Novosphingobium hassiacum]
MDTSHEKIAADWIIYARSTRLSSDDEHERGWVLYELARSNPEVAWQVISKLVNSYAEADLFSDDETEAKAVLSNLAAGPFEELLAEHGPVFIERLEAAARQDRRLFWTLGCIWKNSMTDEIWSRVHAAAGRISR